MTHDPSEYVRGLQQLLVSDKKKIPECLNFLGQDESLK